MTSVDIDVGWTTRGLHPAPPLAADEAHAWWVSSQDAAGLPRRARIDALIRGVLAAYLDQPEASLRIEREPRGRPFLAGNHGFDFNLSDSGGYCLLLVTRDIRSGVDVERLDRQLAHRELARRYYHPEEAAALDAMDDEDARVAFLHLWTAKEAACKATGSGLADRLGSWQFDPAADMPLLHGLPEDAEPASQWRFLRMPSPQDGFTATCAANGPLRRLRLFRLTKD